MDNQPKILVIENEERWQKRIALALKSLDCWVDRAYYHGDALIRIKRDVYLLYILDLDLPGATLPYEYFEGEALLVPMRTAGAHSIVLTNFGTPNVSERILKNNPGVCDFIAKLRFQEDPEFLIQGFASIVQEALKRAIHAQLAEGLTPAQLDRLIHFCL